MKPSGSKEPRTGCVLNMLFLFYCFYPLNTVCCSVATHLTHIRTCVCALNSCYLYAVSCLLYAIVHVCTGCHH